MEQLNKQLREKSRQKKNKRQKTARKNDNKHIESFNEAMAHGNLFEAQQHLSRLTPNMQKSMTVELMQDRLKSEINGYIQQELSAANSFYQAGEYRQAISAWQNIITIEPNNEPVKSKIERAKVIIEKLQSLRERQTTEPRTD
jgi:tetratricopeptide (TPR) repeat protein